MTKQNPQQKDEKNIDQQKSGNRQNTPDLKKFPVIGLTPLEDQFAISRTQAKKESPKAFAGLEEEILKNEAGKKLTEGKIAGERHETIQILESIDLEKKSEEQYPAWQLLEVVTYPLLCHLFQNGIKKDQIENFTNLQNITLSEKLVKEPRHAALVTAFKKLQAISKTPNSPLFQELQPKWSNFCKQGEILYQSLPDSEKNGTESPSPGQDKTPAAPEKKDLSTTEKIWDFVKDNAVVNYAKEHPVIAAIGAYGIFKMLDGAITALFPGKGKSNEPAFSRFGLGTWEAKLTMGGGLVMGALALGSLSGKNMLSDWFNSLISSAPVSKATDAAKEMAGKAADKVKEKAKEVVSQFDEKHGLSKKFTETKNTVEKFCADHGVKVPEWFPTLNLSDAAKKLGIDENNPQSWEEYAKEGGVAFMIYKLLGVKGFGANAVFYLGLVRAGGESYGGEILKGLTQKLDEEKNKAIESMKHFLGADTIFHNEFERFEKMSVAAKTEEYLEWLKLHPSEATLGFNVAYLCRSIIFKAVKTFIITGGKIAIKAAKSPAETLAIGATLATLYQGKKPFIRDLVQKFYSEDPNGKDAKATLEWLGEKLDIDFKKTDTLTEKQIHEFTKSIAEDPINLLEKIENINLFKEGKFELICDATGIFYIIAHGLSAPIQLKNFGWESFKSLSHIYSPEYEGNVMVGTTTVVGEVLLLGRASLAGAGAYAHLFKEGYKDYLALSSGEKGVLNVSKGLWNVFKGLVPGTEEWRFVTRSTLYAPISPILRIWQTHRIGQIQNALNEIRNLAKGGAGNISKIRELASNLLEHHPLFEELERVNKYTKTAEQAEIFKRLKDAKKTIGDIEELTKLNDEKRLKDILRFVDDAEHILGKTKLGLGTILERIRLIMNGEIRAAMTLKDAEIVAKIAEVTGKSAKAADSASEATKVAQSVKNTAKETSTVKKATTTLKEAGSKVIKAGAEAVRETRAAKSIGELVKSLQTGTRTFITSAEASKFGLKTIEIAKCLKVGFKTAIKSPVAKVAGHIFIVADLALTAYTIYDEASQLNNQLKSEGISIFDFSKIPDAITGVVDHADKVEEAHRMQIVQDASDIIEDEVISRKLFKSRNMLVNIDTHLKDYGQPKSGKDQSKEFHDKMNDVLSSPFYAAMNWKFGSQEEVLKKVEQNTLKVEIDQGEKVLENLKQLQPKTTAITRTIKSFEETLRIAKKTLETAKKPAESEIKILDQELEESREAGGVNKLPKAA